MLAWWTSLDLEITCLHENGMSHIQVCDGELHIVRCEVCGQEYIVELKITPVESGKVA